jgi:hypothetical protein
MPPAAVITAVLLAIGAVLFLLVGLLLMAWLLGGRATERNSGPAAPLLRWSMRSCGAAAPQERVQHRRSEGAQRE